MLNEMETRRLVRRGDESGAARRSDSGKAEVKYELIGGSVSLGFFGLSKVSYVGMFPGFSSITGH